MRNVIGTGNLLKYIAIGLVCVFLASAAFLGLELWENGQGGFAQSEPVSDVLTYQGKEYVKKERVESFLVLGLDKYEGQVSADSHASGVQSDFLILFVFDNDAKTISALQINRDTMTKVNKLSVGGTAVVDSYTAQIALAYNYVEGDNEKIRCRNTKNSVEYLLKGVNINHYISFTMDAVAASCDLVDGVEVTVLDDFSGIDDTLIKGETVTLTGEQALRYVRTRKGLEDSSNATRMRRQQQYIKAFYEKAMAKMQSDESFALHMIGSLDDYLVYDVTDQKMQQLTQKFSEYEFLGIKELTGESKAGESFIEFYADEDSVMENLIDLFYEEAK